MQPCRRQWAAGTSSRSQPEPGKEQPCPPLSSDVCFESSLLSFQVFRELLSQPWLLEARDSAPPVLVLMEELGLLESKETAPQVSLLCLPVTG